MDKLHNTFESFLTHQSPRLDLWSFALNLALAALLSYMLSRLYIAFGSTLSNRRILARTFVLITMATMLIIAIVKSSLALSLGLVGALSIVRFRAAIKEPEELAYLFLAIAIGLGFGADQRLITTVAFAIIGVIVWVRSLPAAKIASHNLHITVSSHNPTKAALRDVIAVLDKHCSSVELKRLDDSKEIMEVSFIVNIAGHGELEAASEELRRLGDAVTVSFLDNSRVAAAI